MHLYLWASVASCCLLRPGFSLIGGGDGERGRKYGSERHQDARRSSSTLAGCTPSSSSGVNCRRRLALKASSPTLTAAFVGSPMSLPEWKGRNIGARFSSQAAAAFCFRPQHVRRPGATAAAAHSPTASARLAPQNLSSCSADVGPWSGLRNLRSHLPGQQRQQQLRRTLMSPPRLNAARVDTDDDNFYHDRGRTDPPTAMARRRQPDRRSPAVNGSTSGTVSASSARRGGGRPGTGSGRGVAESGRGGRRAVAASGGGGRGRSSRGGGIDQSDPLVRDWQSAKVLSKTSNRRGRVGSDPEAGQGGRTGPGGERRYVQDSAGRGVGVRGGRGRGGRGRGRGRGQKKTPVGMYVGSDTVPWYIKEVQDKGLDTQGEFSQWWQSNLDPKANVESVKEMKVSELKEQLQRMGLSTTGLKATLAERLTQAYLRCSLSDDNFQHATVTDVTASDEDLPNCFPQVYENLTEAELEKLWRESRNIKKSGS